MIRSGSTWLFNAARLLLQNSSDIDLISGWIDDLGPLKKYNGKTLLIKLHDFDPILAKSSDIILYSFRDIRDVVASHERINKISPTIELFRYVVLEDKQWRKVSKFIMQYEIMIDSKAEVLNGLAKILGVSDYSPDLIIHEIDQMNYFSTDKTNETHNLDNIMHKEHITDGKHGSWKGQLTDTLVKQAEEEFSDWLVENRYPVYFKNI